jgi:signal transduction histidine kinase
MAGLKDLFSLRGSIAARLAVGYGLLIALAIAALSTLFYFGTVGVFERSLDNKIQAIGTRLVHIWRRQGEPGVVREIDLQLHDRIDSDTELVGLLDANGRVLSGNLPRWQGVLPPDALTFETMDRGKGPVSVRLLALPLGDGRRLVVGRDLSELDAIRGVIERALVISAAVSLLLAFAGAQLFRRLIESRVGRIRRTAARIAAGELSSRITVLGKDEFARLGADINQMLDRIESLMEGVRHVSNSIAHDLRTPVTRVRSRLERALHVSADPRLVVGDARLAIEEIDNVISLFDKLLQIAAAETGVRTRSFDTLDLAAIAHDMAELYELVADEQGVLLRFVGAGPVPVRGDRDLLASALASLIDNAIKYARTGVKVDVGARREQDEAVVWVRDYGPGVPEADLDRICERFYRVDQSRHLPGNGLGLSSVTAIAQLHGASLRLRNAGPGLEVSIVFPAH